MRKIKNLKKKTIAAILVAAMVFGVTGCGSSNSSSTTESSETTGTEELKTLRLGVGGQDDNLIMEVGTVAYRNGYFEEELNKVGFTVEFTGFLQTGPEANAAIAAGDLDGAIYGDLPAYTCNAGGIETTIIAEVNSNYQYGIVASNPDIKEPKDLEGKTVIIPQGTVIQFFWEQYAEDNGIDTSTINVINSSDAASLLATGDADATATALYAAYYYESLGVGTVIGDSTSAPNEASTMVVTLENNFLAENPDVAVAINKALIRAYEDAKADPEAFYEVVATDTITKDVMKYHYAFDESFSYLSPEITEEVIERYKTLNQWLVDNQLITEAVDVDKLVDTSYYQQAVSELGQ